MREGVAHADRRSPGLPTEREQRGRVVVAVDDVGTWQAAQVALHGDARVAQLAATVSAAVASGRRWPDPDPLSGCGAGEWRRDGAAG